jgi:ketosteroid isomerase-like protein
MKGRFWSLVNLRRPEDFAGLRRFFFVLLLTSAFLQGCEFPQPASRNSQGLAGTEGDPSAEIVDMLHESTGSWNAGDLDGYLDDYWPSERLTFSGSDGVTRGWGDLRNRYLNSYWAPGAPRDSLRFEELEVTQLGADHALALGRYVLFRPGDRGEVRATGYFSLVLGKVDGEWKILHDHTSAAPVREESGSLESDLTGVG